jgi:multiple sugar transport system substrate-binding protein
MADKHDAHDEEHISAVVEKWAKEKISRRRALSTAGKVAAGIVAAAVIGGVAYAATQAARPPTTVTVTQAPSTVVSTVTSTVTQPTTTTVSTVTTTTTTTTEVTKPAETTTAGPPVTITVWTQETPPHRIARQKAIIKLFEQQHPNIKVELVPVGWEEVYPKVLSSIGAGNPPDIEFSIPPLTLAAYNAGGIVPVDDVVEELDQLYGFGPAEKRMAFWDDHYWAVPIFTLVMGVLIRKDISEAVGYPDGPKTWNEYLDFNKKVSEMDKDPLTGGEIYGNFVPSIKHLFGTEILYTIMVNTGARVVADDGKTIVFNSKETVRALEYYKELAKYRPPGSEDWGWAEVSLPWEKGMLASMYNWSVFITNAIKSHPNVAKQQTYIENPLPDSPPSVRGSVMYPYAAWISKKAAEEGRLEACKAFLKFINQPEISGYLCNMEPIFFLPPHDAGIESEAYKSDPINIEFWHVVETLQKARPYGKLYGFEGPETAKFIGEIEGTDLLALVGQKVVLGEMTPEEAAEWGHAQMEKIARKYEEQEE